MQSSHPAAENRSHSIRNPVAFQDRFPRSPPAPVSTHASSPMPISIPSSTPRSPPPPLPPPRHIEGLGDAGPDPGWQAINRQSDIAEPGSASIQSGSTLLGAHARSTPTSYTGFQKNIEFVGTASRVEQHVDKSDSAHSDQRAPDLGALLEYSKLQGEKHMGLRSNETSSQAYDKHVLSRIGGPHTPPRSAGPHSANTINDDSVGSPGTFRHASGHFRPTSKLHRRTSEPDPSRWSAGPSSAKTLSPSLQALVSPMSDHIPGSRFMSKPANPQQRRPRTDRETYDQVMFGESEPAAEDPSVHELNLHDKSPTIVDASRTGLKRRAESPPVEIIDPNLKTSSNTDWHGRMPSSAGARHPQAARLHDHQPASLSSDASVMSRNGSYASSYAMSTASTATSYSSERPTPGQYQHQERKSPSGKQMSSHQPAAPASPQPLTPFAIPSSRAPPIPHRRQASSGMMRPPNVWICDCCPKKPKKFDSEDELRLHEMEKQYVCQYCHNRFKNKNEAERHQNSLHLRRHSWSCAAMQSFEDAFHPTVNSTLATAAAAHAAATSGNPQAYPPPAPTDTCSYCGIEFANPADWDMRIEHLNHVHKFGECNQSKKFYRADHFRQHLKHSHAGTSGRWTNMLENACMREEMPPQPIGMPMGQLPMGMPPPAGSHQIPSMPQSPSTPGALPGPMTIAGMHSDQPQSPALPHFPPQQPQPQTFAQQQEMLRQQQQTQQQPQPQQSQAPLQSPVTPAVANMLPPPTPTTAEATDIIDLPESDPVGKA